MVFTVKPLQTLILLSGVAFLRFSQGFSRPKVQTLSVNAPTEAEVRRIKLLQKPLAELISHLEIC